MNKEAAAMEYRPYSRRVNYYETDQMAIVHHSNYIRWFEEARLDFLEQVGLNYREMEKTGLIVPVVDVSCRYHVSAKYDDLMDIYAYLTSFNGVRMDYRYEVRFHDSGVLSADGTSSHCFLDEKRHPVIVKRRDPALFARLKELVEKNENL